MSNAKFNGQRISFCAGNSEETEQRYHLGSLPPCTRQAEPVRHWASIRGKVLALMPWHVLPGGTRPEHVDFTGFHHPKLEVYRVYRQEMGKLAQREDATPIGCKRLIAIFGFGG